MNMTCIGCGVQLQAEDQTLLGYVPESARESESVICKRCFRLKHHNEVIPVSMDEKDFLQTLHKIGDTKGLVVKVIDLFDVSGSWITGLKRIVAFNPILIVANKIDLLPQNVNENRLKNKLQQWASESGMKPVDILFCSADKGHGVEKVLQAIDHHRKGQDVYVVGMTNVGKSTFINDILRRFEIDEQEWVTTSRFPGTTLDFVKIPLEDGQSIYDSPGIINKRQITHYLHVDELQTVIPQKSLKPMVYQLNAEQTLFFGGMARFDFVSGDRMAFTCYVANTLNIHRTKLARADELYATQLGELLSPPGKDLEKWPQLVQHSYHLKQEDTDIVIAGLGWINVKDRGAHIVVHAPKGVEVSTRKAFI